MRREPGTSQPEGFSLLCPSVSASVLSASPTPVVDAFLVAPRDGDFGALLKLSTPTSCFAPTAERCGCLSQSRFVGRWAVADQTPRFAHSPGHPGRYWSTAPRASSSARRAHLRYRHHRDRHPRRPTTPPTRRSLGHHRRDRRASRRSRTTNGSPTQTCGPQSGTERAERALTRPPPNLALSSTATRTNGASPMEWRDLHRVQ